MLSDSIKVLIIMDVEVAISACHHACRTGVSVPDGVCNPIRNVLHIHESKGFGRGCKPRPAVSA